MDKLLGIAQEHLLKASMDLPTASACTLHLFHTVENILLYLQRQEYKNIQAEPIKVKVERPRTISQGIQETQDWLDQIPTQERVAYEKGYEDGFGVQPPIMESPTTDNPSGAELEYMSLGNQPSSQSGQETIPVSHAEQESSCVVHSWTTMAAVAPNYIPLTRVEMKTINQLNWCQICGVLKLSE